MIDIETATSELLKALPKQTQLLMGEIASPGIYLSFSHLDINNMAANDVNYHFDCQVAMNPPTAEESVTYQALNDLNNALIEAQSLNLTLEVISKKPVKQEKLTIFPLEITVSFPSNLE